MDQLLVFTAAGMGFGLELGRVRGIHKERNLPAGGAAPHGSLLKVEGEHMPLWDLGRLTPAGPSSKEPDPGGDAQVLVIKAAPGEDAFALRVDGVEGVVSEASDRFSPLPPGFGEKSLSLFPRVLVREEGLVLVIDPGKVRELEPPPRPETESETEAEAEQPPTGEVELDAAIRELLEREPIRSRLQEIMEQVSASLARENLNRLKSAWRRSQSD